MFFLRYFGFLMNGHSFFQDILIGSILSIGGNLLISVSLNVQVRTLSNCISFLILLMRLVFSFSSNYSTLVHACTSILNYLHFYALTISTGQILHYCCVHLNLFRLKNTFLLRLIFLSWFSWIQFFHLTECERVSLQSTEVYMTFVFIQIY